MRKRTKLAAGAGAALAVAGAGGAVAATQLSPTEESTAIVEDAAKQLGVTPAKLDAALRRAFENRIDRAVDEGTLTQEQADAMKQRLEAGEVPLLGAPFLRGHRDGGFGHRGSGHGGLGPRLGFRNLDAAADYLGVTEEALREALRDGKTLADVAEDEGKTVDGLVQAIVAATTAKLDDEVAEGRLTKAQRDEIVAGLEARTRAFVERARPAGPGFGPHRPRGLPGADA
jgi:hypothetical protein